jgi:methyl-accepting chemotaxis protein
MTTERDGKSALESLLAVSEQSSPDTGLFAAALDEVRRLARAAFEKHQETASAIARQATTLASSTDQIQLLTTRDPELRSSLTRLRESLERSRLAALNAGLDGSRMGDAGRNLLAVADDMRVQLTRGIDAFDEHKAMLDELEREFGRLRRDLDAARADAVALREAAQKTQEEQRRVDDAIGRVADALRGVSGLDQGTTEWLARATEHALGLRQALDALGTHANRIAILVELRHLLERLRPLEHSEPDHG